MTVATLIPDALLSAVLGRLGIDAPTRPDVTGLNRIYAAWCERVPFDNTLKMVHLAEGREGPLPGSSAGDFFTSWLETGAGGTCWAGNGALHDLVTALGYSAERATATMMVTPETPASNHGSVVVTTERERYVVDASILTGLPMRVPGPGEPPEPAPDALPRLELHGETYIIMWRRPNGPDGFPCRIDAIGVGPDEWDALHQRTGVWSPFNYAVSARSNRGENVIGYSAGRRFGFDARGSHTVRATDRAGRDRFLIDELGLDPVLVSKLPDDREAPPPPPGFPMRPNDP